MGINSKGKRPKDLSFSVINLTAVLPANPSIFAACMREVLKTFKKNKKNNFLSPLTLTLAHTQILSLPRSYTLSTFRTALQRQRVIPALLFCSSHFNWGFEPGSCLSHCDVVKIAPQQVSENLVRLILRQSLAQTLRLRA